MADAPDGSRASQPVAGVAPSSGGWAEVWDTVRTLVVAVAVALLIRQFVVQTYRVDGISMEPTLQNNERLLVNKFIYRFTPPQPGQVIVFQPPIPGVTTDYVKRVIAVAGQTFSMQNGVVYIDGAVQPEPWLPAAYRDHATVGPITVPPGDVWVLGDHRAKSNDSRYFGPVPISAIRGEAILVWWPPADIRGLPTH